MDSTPGPTPPHYGPLPGTGTELVGVGGETPKEMFGLPVLAELPTVERLPPKSLHQPREPQKKWRRGIFWFVLTCASMWISYSGALGIEIRNGWWIPTFSPRELWNPEGPLFMFAMMSILFSHEMGHFVQSLRYRVPASVPYFIPMPISPIGTMGAVILMGGRNRNRKELFDIGLSGPWAGLAVALPIIYYGIATVVVTVPTEKVSAVSSPSFPTCLLLQWMFQWFGPEVPSNGLVSMNPWLMAGWGAMLLTGLNMLPIGQLDGGHVAYALFRKRAHWIARIAMMIAGLYIVISRDYGWSLMYILALLMRPDHPATHDDSEPIGWPRWLFGFVSLFIPVICLAPLPR